MGLYDINLKRTVIGYQFDHNVYIGNQTNENRVVTFKELGNVINSVSSGGGSGSVTSVAMTAPTGFTVSGSPVTGAGVLALNFANGYSLPTTDKQAEWDSKAVVNANNNFTTTQTITGADDTPLNLYANHATWANIAFYNNTGTRLGNLGFIGNSPYYWGVNGSTDYHRLATNTWVETADHSFSGDVEFTGNPVINQHLTVYGDGETDTDKPTNNTGITGDLDAKYWNTGISTYDADTEVGYQYSFPAHSGTFATLEDIGPVTGCLPLAGGDMNTGATIRLKGGQSTRQYYNTLSYSGMEVLYTSRQQTQHETYTVTQKTAYERNAINIYRTSTSGSGSSHHYQLNLPLKGEIVEEGDPGATLLTDESLKTINGISLVGSGDIVIDTDPSEPRQFTTQGYKKVLNDFTRRYPQDDSVLASDMNLLTNLEVANNHFGLAICKPSFRTLNPDRNGKQERKGWFLEPNICKRGRFNITGFSTEADNYVTSFSFQDLFDYFPIKDGDRELNIVPTLHAVVYRPNIDVPDIVFTLPNTSTYTQLQIEPTSWSVRDVSLVSTGTSRMSPWVMFNLLIGHFGCRYIDTSSFSDRHGYHPRCTWLYAFRAFMLLKRPENTGDNWQLIVHFSTAK